ncbi:hypothetical protein M408DRAFT_330347 [Serendipita vermifera MAFF 305830]|uniref:Telomere replication protein EST3 n=1 Tax=Serendipita vermifera MAFF 305830 TaxID=933852 RepID=A0A0C2XD18_SERVB|nr:hypothetical protein M408DRAFT_330347 [Serendipita vermifera MAFF 305830]
MTNSVQPWILKELKLYGERNGGSMGHLLPQVDKGRQCQLVKWITPKVEQQKGSALWAYVGDEECLIPAKFDREAVKRWDAIPGQAKFAEQLGNKCMLTQVKLLFTKVPLDDGQVGLSADDRLVFQVSDMRTHRGRGRGVDPPKEVGKQRTFTVPEKDKIVGRWIEGLRTGNGFILQAEKERARGGEDLDYRYTPPSTPLRRPKQGTEANKQGSGSAEWDMPAEAKELFERYKGKGVPSPQSDVFSDESDYEGDQILRRMSNHDPNFEHESAPNSPAATIIFSGWYSSPVKAPASDARAGTEEGSEEEDELQESDVEGDGTSDSVAPDDIPYAQPHRERGPPRSFIFASILSQKDLPISQAFTPLPGVRAFPFGRKSAGPATGQPLSWPATLDGQTQNASGSASHEKGKEKEKESQESTISTIAPNSSNEISCSQAFPPAQRSFVAARADDSRDSDSEQSQDSYSRRALDVQSQLSALGDDSSEDGLPLSAREDAMEPEVPEANLEREVESHRAEEEEPPRSPPRLLHQPSTVPNGPTHHPLERGNLAPLPISSHAEETLGVKRARPAAEQSMDGPIKRPKVDGDPILKPGPVSLKPNPIPQGSVQTSETSRPSVIGGGKDLTRSRALQVPHSSRVEATKSKKRTKLSDLILSTERRSDKYRNTIKPYDQ